MIGLRAEGGYAPSLPPYHTHQETGAFLVLGAMLLWRARRDLAGGWSKAWEPAQRRTALGLLASGGAILAWATAARIPLLLAGGFLVVYSLFSVVLGRLAAESGGPSSFPPLSTHETIALLGSMDRFSQRSLVTFGWWMNLGGQITDGLIPHQTTGARLAEEVQAER